MTLTPFSYVVLTLVGSGGATAPELAEMMERGPLYWTAPRSQWYAEPKKLEAAGYLTSDEEPGRTGPRRRYRLTAAGRAALADWIGTPVGLPRIQHEAAVRVLAADLVDDPRAVLRALPAFREAIGAGRDAIGAGREAAARLPERQERLLIQNRMGERMLDALEAWADEIEAHFSA